MISRSGVLFTLVLLLAGLSADTVVAQSDKAAKGVKAKGLVTSLGPFRSTVNMPVVVTGSTVELEDVTSSDVVSYQIVGEDEADIKQAKISITSPIARALIGKYAGDQVDVQTPGGVRTFEIVDVRYE